MASESSAEPAPDVQNQFTPADLGAILRERGWLGATEERAPDLEAWLADATALLGPQAADRDALAGLLGFVFHYDAPVILALPESHAVLAREGAREVIRELANRILDGPDVDSDRFKEIVNELKNALPHRGRELFYPMRLALAGRAGEGELDRVILLLDRAAKLAFPAPVKGTRQRMLEFCAALD